ncbi:DUF3450 family protein [Thalassotalea euphylliae]|uniref:DUF3450 family protein n=1 Tax=Thalassotalea euphylliae TaxID=1655234 RepID=A0A3E0TQJ4_9GAMM|nr:DUF3450 family protein [Thalassotalea euphylliae]REL26911.1 DUF3450 family protein [Thalassotalea euphylliae]
MKISLLRSQLAWLVFAALSATSVVASEQGQVKTTTPATIDQLTKQWLDLAQSSNQLQQDWQLEQQQLELRIALLKEQNKILSSQISQDNSQQDQVNQQRQAILTEQTVLEKSVGQYQKALPAIINQLQTLVASLPPYLAEQLKGELAQLSLRGNQIETQTRVGKSLSNEYQAIASIIKQLTKSSGLIQLKQGVIDINGSERLTQQLYFGHDQAWFISSDNSFSGIGFRQQNSWQWLAVDDANEQIRQAINHAESQTPGQLINLPIALGAH